MSIQSILRVKSAVAVLVAGDVYGLLGTRSAVRQGAAAALCRGRCAVLDDKKVVGTL